MDKPGSDGFNLQFTADVAEFLDACGPWLAADPVANTVIGTVAERMRHAPPPRDRPFWWLVVRDNAGTILGAAMRTAPSEPFTPYLCAMPTQAAVALADALHQRGESISSVNGNEQAARALAERWTLHAGGVVETLVQLRQFEATQIVDVPRPAGTPRQAMPGEADLVECWCREFGREADVQAGREPGTGHAIVASRNQIDSDIAAARVWFWCDDAGTPVHLTAVSPPSAGVRRIGPVFTPVEHRGCGYASFLVAQLSREVLAQGDRVCLYTDQANPTSNAIYQALGYRPLADSVELAISVGAEVEGCGIERGILLGGTATTAAGGDAV